MIKKTYKLENLDCANCAAKMEHAIHKVDGISSATVNFMTQKMIIEIDSEDELESMIEQIKKICKKIEPDCTILG